MRDDRPDRGGRGGWWFALAAGLLVIGAGILLWPDGGASTSPVSGHKLTPRQLKQVLFLLTVLVLVFAVSVLAFVRWSRRYRRYLLHKSHEPTPSSDVWAMHRVPEPDEPEAPHELPDGPAPR